MLFLVADVLTRRGDWLTKEYDQHTHIIIAGYITSNSDLHYMHYALYTHIIVAGYITSNSRLRSALLYIYQDLAKTLKCTAPTVGIVYTV